MGHCAKNLGHGQIGIGCKVIGTHRLSWKLHFGDIATGLCVCHKCDNGSCVNPDHLFVGTREDNNIDMAKKERTGKNIVTAEQVIEIRRLRETTSMTLREIGKLFGVGHTTISAIIQKQNWKWL